MLTCSLTILLATAADTPPDVTKADLAKFQGDWQLVSLVRDGKQLAAEDGKRLSLSIRGNAFVLHRDDKVLSEGTFTLDPAKKPKAIDETITNGPNKGKVFTAIYEIDDERHRICFAAPGKQRPTAFASEPGSGQLLQVWKRIAKDPAKQVTNSLGMKFVWIPPGAFAMGSPNTEKGRGDDEIVRQIAFSKGLYLGTHVVTQQQWRAVMGNNPSTFEGANLPVEGVSWEDCQEFCRKLRERDKKPYRLPTEAEWEYACRAGTTTPFHFGETLSTDQANYNGQFVYGPGKKGVYRQKTVAVDAFPPNAWGLYGMHGNVWQWCQDRHGGYAGKDVVDPQGPRSGSNRVLRGGSWTSNPIFCRSANRNFSAPDNRTEFHGCRVCFSVE